MSREELIKNMEENDLAYYLDDIVHSFKSMEASNINNSGPEAQVDYLLSNGFSIDDILDELGHKD